MQDPFNSTAMLRDYQTFFLHLAVMLAVTAGITAVSALIMWMLMGVWPLWEHVLTLFGIMAVLAIIIAVYRLMTEWTYFDEDDE